MLGNSGSLFVLKFIHLLHCVEKSIALLAISELFSNDKNTKIKMTKAENYQKQKMEFLDSLQPDDFRNGGSFNQAELIIDELCKAASHKENPQEFIEKAAIHLFRENSSVVVKIVSLAMNLIKPN